MKKSIAALLTFGAAGHTLHCAPDRDENGSVTSHCHCTGYEDPESFVAPYHWWAHEPGRMITHWDGYTIPRAGIPVIDMRAAVDTPEGLAWVFHGPMVDTGLVNDQINALPEISPIMLPAIAAYGQLGAVAETRQAQKQGKPGPLDSVSVQAYVAGWKEHGARIGTFRVVDGNGQIEWEN